MSGHEKRPSTGRRGGAPFVTIGMLLIAVVPAVVLALPLLGRAAAEPAAQETGATAFINVNVVPMDRERVLEQQVVVVRDGWIRQVGPKSEIRVPDAARVVDGRGRYLLPGLAEMHGHIPWRGGQSTEDILFLYVAAGATTVRGMQGHPSQLALRERVKAGEIVGPDLWLSGPAMSGNRVQDPATARRLVQEYRDLGFDLLKVHEGLTPEVYREIARTARQEGLPWGGHVADRVGLEMALELGQATIDHLDNYLAESGGDEDRLRELARLTRRKGAAVVPTMALWEVLRGAHDVETLLQRPELRYMPRETVESWARNVRRRTADTSGAEARRTVEGRKRVLRILHDEGVAILMGTDAPQLFSVPGFSLHRELAVMAEAGMTPYEILRTGTVEVARHLEMEDRAGTVAPGMRANLLLVDENPLEDIARLQDIAGVMVRGRWLDRETLDARLEAIAAR